MMHNISFAHPWLLLLLLVIPLMAAWYVMRHKKLKAPVNIPSVDSFGDESRSLRYTLFHLRFVLRCLATMLLIVALARPQSKLSHEEMEVEGIDIVLSMDVSGSMLAEDFKPTRLEAAKDVATNFINGRQNDRIGLVEFAGEAFTQTPLTIDHDVLLGQLKGMKTGVLEDGTAIGDGLATAINRIKDSKAVSKVIILLTDGVNNRGFVDPESAAEIAADYGIRLYTIGIGSRGEAIAHDNFGRPMRVSADIDEDLLSRMAQHTNGGRYFRATNKNALGEIFEQIDTMEKTRIEVTQYRQTREEFKPLVAVALLLLLLELAIRLFN